MMRADEETFSYAIGQVIAFFAMLAMVSIFFFAIIGYMWRLGEWASGWLW